MMLSKIFRRKDGSYTLQEYEGSVQNVSVIPLKYSYEDTTKNIRKGILKEELLQ